MACAPARISKPPTGAPTAATLLACASLAVGQPAAADSASPLQGGKAGQIACVIQENGTRASGTVAVRDDDREVAQGSCDDRFDVPAGRYTVVLRLDGALDEPSQTRSVTVRAGNTSRVKADFATGTLKVELEARGNRAAGMAVVLRDGKQIGTMGSGVSTHLSTGTYVVVVRYRDREKRYEGVTLSAGERRVLHAKFK